MRVRRNPRAARRSRPAHHCLWGSSGRARSAFARQVATGVLAEARRDAPRKRVPGPHASRSAPAAGQPATLGSRTGAAAHSPPAVCSFDRLLHGRRRRSFRCLPASVLRQFPRAHLHRPRARVEERIQQTSAELFVHVRIHRHWGCVRHRTRRSRIRQGRGRQDDGAGVTGRFVRRITLRAQTVPRASQRRPCKPLPSQSRAVLPLERATCQLR